MPNTIDAVRETFGERGISNQALRHAFRTGRLRRIARGTYVLGKPDDFLTIVRTAALRHPHAVVSHDAAAALRAMWCPWPQGWRRVVLTSRTTHHESMTATIVKRRLDPQDVVVIDGIRSTTPARTALDIAGTVALPEAMVVVDCWARMNSPSRRQCLDPAFRLPSRMNSSRPPRGCPHRAASRRQGARQPSWIRLPSLRRSHMHVD